jgi:hypothetical protein
LPKPTPLSNLTSNCHQPETAENKQSIIAYHSCAAVYKKIQFAYAQQVFLRK